MSPEWVFLHPNADYETLGYIPSFLDLNDPRPAREQINDRYKHGGGWQPSKGHLFDSHSLELQYPGDPPRDCIAYTILKEERIFFYPGAWVVIEQKKDMSFEVARLD